MIYYAIVPPAELTSQFLLLSFTTPDVRFLPMLFVGVSMEYGVLPCFWTT